MLESILLILAELGLIREDFKHRRNITKKEKADGKKRPFQKYVLQPSVLGTIYLLIIANVCFFLFFVYQNKIRYPQKTKHEITAISETIEQWKEKFGAYPTRLEYIIRNNPMKQLWKTDAWNRPYHYFVTENGANFLIISAGKDGVYKTEDDITSE